MALTYTIYTAGAITPDFGLVVLAAVLILLQVREFLNIFLLKLTFAASLLQHAYFTLKVGGARKKYGVKYPALYAIAGCVQ